MLGGHGARLHHAHAAQGLAVLLPDDAFSRGPDAEPGSKEAAIRPLT